MRLECLFQQVIQTAQGRSEWDSRAALQGLFEIFNLTSRSELKAELLKELERHAVILNRLRPMPGVDMETLDAILAELSQTIDQFRDPSAPSLEIFRQHDFLNTVRNRSALPGGACTFDLPTLQHWLQQDGAARTQDLENWLLPFEPMGRAVNLILRLIRYSALPQNEIAVRGFFQKALDSRASNQMVRVILPAESAVFPEISTGRHRFSIRFMEQTDLTKRPSQCTEDISFQLVCCII
jgi:cell division protein ZapD